MLMSLIQFVRLFPDVIPPKRGSVGAAAFDLYAHSMTSEGRGYTVRTGLSIALPAKHCMLLLPRSGLATKFGLTLQNSVGLIDEDYRGEIIIKFNRGYDSSHGEITEVLQRGNRVAQALIVPVPDHIFHEVEVLPSTERGTAGFGSTGVER
jgi:dUTP pyrophosphatase